MAAARTPRAHPVVSIGVSTHPVDPQARADVRRHRRLAIARRAGWIELPLRHLALEPFGGVVDERNGDRYQVNRSEIDADYTNIAAYSATSAATPHSLSGRSDEPRRLHQDRESLRLRRILGPIRGTGAMFHRSGLSTLSRETLPVVIDHDHALVVGEVIEFVVWPFTDQRWIVARARLERRLPRTHRRRHYRLGNTPARGRRRLGCAAATVTGRGAPPAPGRRSPHRQRHHPRNGRLIRRNIGRVLGVW